MGDSPCPGKKEIHLPIRCSINAGHTLETFLENVWSEARNKKNVGQMEGASHHPGLLQLPACTSGFWLHSIHSMANYVF
jgi:hypothetical protein